jgi:hypothetical protein
MFKIEALQILLFLAPGFLASILLNTFCVREKKSEVAFVVEALVFSILIYSIYLIGFNQLPVDLSADGLSLKWHLDWLSVFILLFVTIFLAIFASYSINHDWHTRLARKIKLGSRTSRASPWLDVVASKGPYVIINFSNGDRLYGQLTNFSDDPEKLSLYIFSPYWLDKDGRVISHHVAVDGVFVPSGSDIKFIQFLDSSNF